MAKINLHNLYPTEKDVWFDVSEEVADLFLECDHQEAAYQRKLFRYKAYFSFDCNPGLEKDILSDSKNDECKENIKKVIHLAMSHLTSKQAKRIYAHYYLGMSKAEIARKEGVKRQSIDISISLGLKKMKKFLKNIKKRPDKRP